jgi:formamidopyrimidine-DNA glycosylase
MPELPEVETTRRGIQTHLVGQPISGVIVRQRKLRWEIPALDGILPGLRIEKVRRRAKYLLIDCAKAGRHEGTLIMHLGMSGSLRVLPVDSQAYKHDHFDLQLGDQCLRLRDPRRFGAILWTQEPAEAHPLIASLGPEPLSEGFNADYLFEQAKRRKVPIKQLLMDGKVVVGVGNIYATESLFLAGIHPTRLCNRVSKARLEKLVEHVKIVLACAIERGGTTLRDFQQQDGRPGYFQQELRVYGREGEPCRHCGTTIRAKQIGQRTSSYCPRCQH